MSDPFKSYVYRLSNGQRIGRYVIRGPLGHGGMGEVYLAEDVPLGRQIALKVLREELTNNRDDVQRFKQEARAASALNHPNIITIHEIGLDGTTHFIAAEFIEGETLGQHIQAAAVDLSETVDIAMQIASALAIAHKEGIIHRDIKPGNVMLRNDHLVKVVDFGLAKLTRPATPREVDHEAETDVMVHTSPGLVVGTVNYMSPEQLRGQDLDARTDIFSFGSLLYELLTGRIAFGGKKMEVVGAIQYRDPEPMPDIVPAKLQEVVHKALRKNPDERYQTMEAMVADLHTCHGELKAANHTPIVSRLAEAVKNEGVPHLNDLAGSANAPPDRIDSIRPNNRTRQALIALIVLLALVLGAVYFLRPRHQIKSVAVKPFSIEGDDKNINNLGLVSLGITDFLIRRLPNVTGLTLNGRDSVYHYNPGRGGLREMGQTLNVDAIVTGQIRLYGSRISVSVNVVETATEKSLWSSYYDDELGHLSSLRSGIARDLAYFFNPNLSADVTRKITKIDSSDPEAEWLYAAGRRFWKEREPGYLKKAIEKYGEAVARDPDYAEAYVGMADCYVLLEDLAGENPAEALRKAGENADKAIKIDPSLAAAHASLGFILFNKQDWQNAEIELRKAIQLDPNYPWAYHWYAVLLRTLGGARLDEAGENIKRAYNLDLASPVFINNLGIYYLTKSDPDSAIKEFNKAIQLDQNSSAGHFWLGIAFLKNNQPNDALDEAQKGADGSLKGTSVTLELQGYIEAANGSPKSTKSAVAKAEELEQLYKVGKAVAFNVAAVYAGLKDNDKAFFWLNKARDDGSGLVAFVKMPMFDSLRTDQRYGKFLGDLGLKP